MVPDGDRPVRRTCRSSDYERALEWYPRLLGDVETFDPNDSERVFTLAEHRYVYVVHHPERAGHGLVTLFVEDHDGFVGCGGLARRRAHHPRDLRERRPQDTYHDPEGNEIGIGGGPQG